MHCFKRRSDEMIIKKIDLQEKINLKGISKHLKIPSSLPSSQRALNHPNFRTDSSRSSRPPLLSKKLKKLENQEHLPYNQTQSIKMHQRSLSTNYQKQQNRTYNNNYKLFPKGNSFKRPYVIKNSNIIINIFSRTIEIEEKRNSFLAKCLSLQLKDLQQSQTHRNQPSPSKSKTSYRIESARQTTKPKQIIEKFTPWEVFQAQYSQQI